MWKRKGNLPRYHPENLQEGETAEIITGYETYVERLRVLNIYSEKMEVEVVDQGDCREGIDRWFIVLKRKELSNG